MASTGLIDHVKNIKPKLFGDFGKIGVIAAIKKHN